MSMIIADNLAKAFPTPDGSEKLAVAGVSFAVEPGTIYGLLGPNGAGKTTTLRMLCGLVLPTAGHAVINGHDVQQDPMAVKRVLGFLTANTGLYQRLSVRDVLIYFAKLHGMTAQQAAVRAAVLIDTFDMNDFATLRCGSLSTGQKQRCNIARALVADPPALILDEPTLGLDVLSNRVMLNFIRDQRDAGKGIILSTHYLDEAETLCDHIGLIHQGKLIAHGTLDELRTLSGEQRLSDIFLKLIHEEPVHIV
jgi:sodium transport system ATP-binding protein